LSTGLIDRHRGARGCGSLGASGGSCTRRSSRGDGPNNPRRTVCGWDRASRLRAATGYENPDGRERYHFTFHKIPLSENRWLPRASMSVRLPQVAGQQRRRPTGPNGESLPDGAAWGHGV
jgi:hypothetical protein